MWTYGRTDGRTFLPGLSGYLSGDDLKIHKITRDHQRGNALLIGVGGSGKQSLSRLAAFIAGLEVFQITLKKGYEQLDLKNDLAALYQKAGTKNVGIVFLMTDAQASFLLTYSSTFATSGGMSVFIII